MKIHLEMNKDYGKVVRTGTSFVLFIITYVVCFYETFMTAIIWSDQLNVGVVILVSEMLMACVAMEDRALFWLCFVSLLLTY